jgi:hypothetical protein
MSCYVVWLKFTKFSEDFALSPLQVEKMVDIIPFTFQFLYSDDTQNMSLRNFGKYLQYCTANVPSKLRWCAAAQ